MLSDEVKKLEEENRELKKLAKDCAKQILELRASEEHYKECCEMMIPIQVYHCKKRRNTTVKFKDGSQITVKRRVGDRNCLETAIAYAVLKQLITKSRLNKLIKERKEIK